MRRALYPRQEVTGGKTIPPPHTKARKRTYGKTEFRQILFARFSGVFGAIAVLSCAIVNAIAHG